MKTENVSHDNENGNCANRVLPPVIYCTCKKVECYRRNGLSQFLCGICNKPLNKEQSEDIGRSIASYYGW